LLVLSINTESAAGTGPPAVYAKVADAGTAFNTGCADTEKVTGISSGLFPAAGEFTETGLFPATGELTEIVPVWLPLESPVGSTETVMFRGVVLPA
jgi:hypothetical protein